MKIEMKNIHHIQGYSTDDNQLLDKAEGYCKTSPQEIYNVSNKDDRWKQLLAKDNSNGNIRFTMHSDFPLSEFERQLFFLRINDTAFHKSKSALLTENIVKLKLYGKENEITIAVDTENKMLHVYNPNGLEISFNFRLETRQKFLEELKNKSFQENIIAKPEQTNFTLPFQQKDKGKTPRL